jgi:hypothetical protein
MNPLEISFWVKGIVIMLLLNATAKAFDHESFEPKLPTAAQARARTKKAIRENAKTEKEEAWQDIVTKVEIAIDSGQSRVDVSYDQKFDPEFKNRIIKLGYGWTCVPTVSSEVTISWEEK